MVGVSSSEAREGGHARVDAQLAHLVLDPVASHGVLVSLALSGANPAPSFYRALVSSVLFALPPR